MSNVSRRMRLPVASIALVLSAAWQFSTPARAGTGGSFYLPLRVPQQTYAGLMIKVDTDWAQGYGYRPVRLELIATQPASDDRSLTVELSLNDYSNRSVLASKVLTLPAGSRNIVQWVPVPQLANDQVISVRTLAGGREIEDLSTSQFSIGSGQYWAADSGIPRTLFVADKPPDVSGMKFFGSQPYMPYGNVSFGKPQDVAAFAYLKSADLFDESIYYSALDMIFMSRVEAKYLAAKSPKVWQAIDGWVRSGGTLVLFGVNHDDTDLSDVEQLLKSSDTVSPMEVGQEAAKPRRSWFAPKADIYEQKVVAAMNIALAAAEAETLDNATQMPAEETPTEQASGDENNGDASGTDGKAEPEKAADGEAGAMPDAPFLWRPVGLGYVVAWRDAKPFPGEELDWRWLMASLPEPCTRWTMRHGSSPDQSNSQFNDMLIADVGLPPIQTYKVLITFFVVLIGPVNYWLLKRFERLHLFLFTVPLAALIATGGLLGYALMADGLDSRMRSRSLTMLDQRAGQAASSAWLSYYVGFTPSSGLTFPRETVVTPLELEPAYHLSNGARRRIVWDKEQQLTRGWLPARTPMQLVTERAYSSSGALVFGLPETDGGRKVTNNLGVRVHKLLVCDEDGKLLSAGELDGVALEGGQQGTLNRLGTQEAETAATLNFLKIFDQHAPAPPIGMDSYGSQNAWRWFGMRRMTLGSQKQFGVAKTGLEFRLDELRTAISAGTLKPQSYVAIVDRPPEVSAGLNDLTETESTHVIHGAW